MADPRNEENPLSADDLARLRRGRAVLNQAYVDIQRCKDCGIDARAEQALADALAARVDKILQHYGQQRGNA